VGVACAGTVGVLAVVLVGLLAVVLAGGVDVAAAAGGSPTVPGSGAAPVASSAAPAAPPTGAVFAIAPVSAANVVSPRTSFDYDVRPGQQLVDSFRVDNFSSTPQAFELWPADAYDTAVGGFALRPVGWHNTGVGSWVTLPVGSFTVPAHTATTFTFGLRVPANATPGEYAGGIVALDVSAPAAATSGAAQVTVHHGAGVAMFVRVQGPLHPSVALGALDVRAEQPLFGWLAGGSGADVRVTVRNTGNTIVRGVASARVVDGFGRTVKRFPAVRVSDLLPGNRAVITEPRWQPLPLFGAQHVQVRFVAAGIRPASASTTFWVVPWTALALLALAGGGAVAWVVRRRRVRRHRPRQRQGPPGAGPEPDGDRLAHQSRAHARAGRSETRRPVGAGVRRGASEASGAAVPSAAALGTRRWRVVRLGAAGLGTVLGSLLPATGAWAAGGTGSAGEPAPAPVDAASPASPAPSAAPTASAPQVTVTPWLARVGATVTVRASGLPAHAVVQVTLCGELGVTGSVDCSLDAATTKVASETGTLTTPYVLHAPPAPCPCAVELLSPQLATPLDAPVLVGGVPWQPGLLHVPAGTAPAPATPPAAARQGTARTVAGTSGGGAGAGWAPVAAAGGFGALVALALGVAAEWARRRRGRSHGVAGRAAAGSGSARNEVVVSAAAGSGPAGCGAGAGTETTEETMTRSRTLPVPHLARRRGSDAIRRQPLRRSTVLAAGVAAVGVVVTLATIPAAFAAPSLTVTPDSGLTNGQSVTVSGSGFHASSPGGILECNAAPGEPTVAVAGSQVPVGCTNPLSKLVTTTSTGTLAATSFTVRTGTIGPPASGTDSAGNSATADAANYPCPPTPAQQANGVTCVIAFGDLAGDQATAQILFEGETTGTSTTTTTGASTTTTSPTTTTTTTTGASTTTTTAPPSPTTTSASTTTTVAPATAGATGSTTTTVAPATKALAFTGPGPKLWWVALAGVVLVDLGYLVLSATWRPRLLGAGVGSSSGGSGSAVPARRLPWAARLGRRRPDGVDGNRSTHAPDGEA